MNNIETITYKNRGMLLESIINKSINFFYNNNIALIHKKEIPLKILKVNKANDVKAILNSKSTVDYYGLVKGRFICFEAKSTNENFIYFQNIKNHQHQYLIEAERFGGFSFYIFYFKNHQKFYFLRANKLDFLKSNKISLEEVNKKGIELSLNYPGVLNFLDFID
ncbi:Holliday junction resolvase RecU [[Mycoplasma] mobile]|nr:Holliday junction resolvase RecU [[Mycoplasma] mobile]